MGFNKEVYRRFELPRKLGKVISGWDEPQTVEAAAATHMRADDYVIGVLFKGRARAYPLWIIDHYHIVNDRVEDEPLVVASCERCQTGGAFIPAVEGNPNRPPLFRGVGFMNATLLMKDMRTGSYWNHSVGRCLSGRAESAILPWVPVWHMEWRHWVAAHPDSTVMIPPRDPTHPDARHGHGRDEVFARPGMEPVFVPTIVGELDDTYPENEMVLCVGEEHDPMAYPLREVQRHGGVVQEEREGGGIAVFAGPQADGFTMAAYVPSARERALSFERFDGLFRDEETGSLWTIEGQCAEGPLAGEELTPVPWFYMRWHAWIYNHRTTRLFRSDRQAPRFKPAETPSWAAKGHFDAYLTWLRERTSDVRLEEPVVSQLRPRESVSSVVARVAGCRIKLHRFETPAGAEDYDTLAGAWSCFPLKPKVLEAKTRRIGTLVVERYPERQFVDPLSIITLSEDLLPWSTLLDEPVDEAVANGDFFPGESQGPGFSAIVRAIRRSGLEVLELAFLPPGQLRPGCANGIALTIEGDRFLLYRFSGASVTGDFAERALHSVAIERFVLRSVPATMYEHQGAEILYAGDDAVQWSPLLTDRKLLRALTAEITAE